MSCKDGSSTNSVNQNNGKSFTALFLLWFFLGQFGGHRFYLGKKHAVTMLVLTLVGALFSWLILPFFLCIVVFIWWLIDISILVDFEKNRQK